MATYKVLQDIEAEDTLIGKLTLRQCIYAAIAVVAGYLSFIFITKHVAFMVIFMLPFIAGGVFFAFPWSKQQTTEVWALAKVRFYLKPRKRIWNQSGVKELVTITVPRNVKRAYASTLTPVEVKSRLKALADTIDSRGWAIKNVDLGYYTKPSLLNAGSDRLIEQSNAPGEVPDYNTTDVSDIFDMENSPTAQKLDSMMAQSADAHRQHLVDELAGNPGAGQPQAGYAAQPVTGLPGQGQTAQPTTTDFWHGQPGAATQPVQQQTPFTLPAPQMPGQDASMATTTYPPAPMIQYSNLRTLSVQSTPLTTPAAAVQTPANQPQTTVTAQHNPAILELANNNDLNIATIAREAQARSPENPDEVVVSLH